MSETTETHAIQRNAGHLGDREMVAAIRRRMESMMQIPKDVPDYVLWQAAQLSAIMQLNPFTGDLYLMEVGSEKDESTNTYVKRYSVHIGIKGLRKIARRKANFQTEFRTLTADEVRSLRRTEYDEEDVGVECKLYRLDVAMQCKIAGIPYHPIHAVGFWRKRGVLRYVKGGSKEWVQDNIPNTWTAYQVAQKRAEVSALKQAFDLEMYDTGDPGLEGDANETFRVVQHQLETLQMQEAPVMTQPVIIEDDGDILFAGSTRVESTQKSEPFTTEDNPFVEEVDFGMMVVSPDVRVSVGKTESTPKTQPKAQSTAMLCPICHAPEGKPHRKNCPNAAEMKEDSRRAETLEQEVEADIEDAFLPYVSMLHNPDIQLPPTAMAVIKQIRTLDSGKRKMSKDQHGYIVGLIDALYGSKDFQPHKYILSALCGRVVDHDHPLSYDCKILIDWAKDKETYSEQMVGINQVADAAIEIYRDMEDM